MEVAVKTSRRMPYTPKFSVTHVKPLSVAQIVELIEEAQYSGVVRRQEILDAIELGDECLAKLFRQRLNLEGVSLEKMLEAIEEFEDMMFFRMMMEEMTDEDNESVSEEEIMEALR